MDTLQQLLHPGVILEAWRQSIRSCGSNRPVSWLHARAMPECDLVFYIPATSSSHSLVKPQERVGAARYVFKGLLPCFVALNDIHS
jgi:hypothetical protein